MGQYCFNTMAFREGIANLGIGSLNEFALKSGIHRNTLLSYLNGSRSPLTSTVEDIALALGVDPLDLVVKTDEAVIAYYIRKVGEALAPHLNAPSPRALVMFGSRARGDNRRFSDVDLAITGSMEPIKTREFLQLKEVVEQAMEDSPVKVDFVNLDQAPLDLLLDIDRDLTFLAGSKEVYLTFKGIIYGFKKAFASRRRSVAAR